MENIHLDTQELLLGGTKSTVNLMNKTALKYSQHHFYYDAMVFLMNKQTKILEYQQSELLKARIPEINLKSRIMAASDPNRLPLYARTPKPVQGSPIKHNYKP